MHSSVLLATVILAGPSFAAPTPIASQPSGSSSADNSSSEALKLPSFGTIANIASLGIPVIGGIIDHFKNKDPKQARELEEFFARQTAAGDDESDALKLPSLGTISTIASVAGPVIGGIIDHFKHKDPQQARELEELFARQLSADHASGAAKLTLEDFKNIASIGGSVVSVAHNIFDSFKSDKNQNQQREFEDIMVRKLVELAARDDDDSEAFSLGALKSIGKIALKAGGLLGGLFGGGDSDDQQQQQQRRRELVENLLSRQITNSGTLPPFLRYINHFPINSPGLVPSVGFRTSLATREPGLTDEFKNLVGVIEDARNRVIVSRSLNELD